VTRSKALERTRKLLALAAPGSGASEEEARTAAAQAVRLMSEYGLAPGGGPESTSSGSASTSSPLDELEISALKLQVAALERLLAARQAEHAREIREANGRRSQDIESVRREERAAANRRRKTAECQAVAKERKTMAKSGGRARARKLDRQRRVEIAREGARARWAKWRERHQS